MDNRPIGVFDSGIGGLTVLNEIKKINPNEKIIYLGDTKRFPYGSKSKETIIEISKECVDFLITKNVKMIIIACGTATSQAIETLKKVYELPIIGIIEPTIIDIKKDDTTKSVGVIATKGTIRSNAWETRLKDSIDGVKVINNEAPILAPLAETGWIDNEVAESAIKEYMKPFKDIDKLILGCTHYPLFTPIIKREIRENTEIINTGEKLSKYLMQYLIKNQMERNDNNEGTLEDRIYLTDIEEAFIQTANTFLEDKEILDNIEKLDLN